MNVIEAIKARYSVRSFEQLPVRTADVGALLDAAVHAPSALNTQPWAFAIVQDRERLQRYSDGAKRLALRDVTHDPKSMHYESLLRGESFNVFHGAATLIAICAPQNGFNSEAAVWLSAQNLMLAALCHRPRHVLRRHGSPTLEHARGQGRAGDSRSSAGGRRDRGRIPERPRATATP